MRGSRGDDGVRTPYPGKSQVAIGSFRNASSGHSRKAIGTLVMHGSRKFSQSGSEFDNVLFLSFFC